MLELPGFKIPEVLPLTLGASLQVGVSMELRESSRWQATATVKAIDILGDSELDDAILLHLDNGHMCGGGQGIDDGGNCCPLRPVCLVSGQLPNTWSSLQDSVHTTAVVWDPRADKK